MSKNPLTTYTKNTPNASSESRVYSALAGLGRGWHDTRAIASTMGRKYLYKSDRAVLARLVAADILELRAVPADPRPHLDRYEYRLIGNLPPLDP